MNQVLLETVIFSIPEALVVLFLATSILGRKYKWTSLIAMGLIFGVTSPLIRYLTGSYVLNIGVSSLMLIAVLKLFGRNNVVDSVTAGLMAVSIYLSVEYLNVKTLQVLTGIDPIVMGQSLSMRALWFLSQLMVATGLAFIIRHFTIGQLPHAQSSRDVRL